MAELKKLYIVGSGGFGREILWLAKRINDVRPVWNIMGFLDDDEALHGRQQDDYPVLGGCSYLETTQESVYVVVAIGSAKTKKKVVEKLSQYDNVKFATLIDPSVILSDRVKIGEGCMICAGTIITVDVVIGKHVIVNLDCTLGHDDVIGNYVTVYPSVNVSGIVNVGDEAELGTGAQIIQGKTIGKKSILGAGAVVVHDIPENCVAVGSPAKPIKYF